MTTRTSRDGSPPRTGVGGVGEAERVSDPGGGGTASEVADGRVLDDPELDDPELDNSELDDSELAAGPTVGVDATTGAVRRAPHREHNVLRESIRAPHAVHSTSSTDRLLVPADGIPNARNRSG